MQKDKALLSPGEIADATGMEVKTVRAAIARGDIPSARFGRLIKVPRWWLEEQLHGPEKARSTAAAAV